MDILQTTRSITDKFAISLSFLCAAHCLVLPLLFVLLPSFAALGLESEAFHTWMIALVLPTSLFALTMGCQQHKNYQFLVIGILGIGLLVSAVALGEERISEIMEKILTLAGASLVAFSHFRNYRLCQKSTNDCHCHEHDHE